MIDERKEAQASLYALGALPMEEVREFEQALRTDLELQLLVSELRSTADFMVAAFPQVAPPAALKQSILGAVLGPDMPSAPVIVPPDSFLRGLQNWLPWALAACFAVLCALLLGVGHSIRKQATDFARQLEEKQEQYTELQQQNDVLQSQVNQSATNYSKQVGDLRRDLVQKAEESQKAQRQTAEVQRQLDQRAAEAQQAQRQVNVLQRQLAQSADEIRRLNDELTSPANVDRFKQTVMALLSPTPDGSVRSSGAAMWDIAEQKGVLIVESMAALPATQDYQLWLLGDPKTAGAVSAGIVPVDQQGNARIEFRTGGVLVDAANRFAISIERKLGSPAPLGKIVMARY